jgi:hypothetical protein
MKGTMITATRNGKYFTHSIIFQMFRPT